MKGNAQSTAAGKRYFFLLIIGILLACLIMSLPLYTVTVGIFTKKSSNTFVGDEKYQEVLAEVEEVEKQYRDQGMEVEISEDVTVRTNSKGEETSLVAFTISQTMNKNVWSFLSSGMPSARVLYIMLFCMAAAVILAFAGCAGTMNTAVKELPGRCRRLRSLSCFFLLIDMLLVPVFILMNNYLFWRKTSLYQADLVTEGRDEWYGILDSFLFQGRMGEEAGNALKNLNVSHSPLLWVLLLCFGIALAGCAGLRFGALERPFLRFLLYLFVITICVITLYPYYVMLITAFRSNSEALDMYFLHLLPTKWVWKNLSDIIERGVPQFLANSLMIAGGATGLAMLCGIPAAFAMARMNFLGKKFFLGFVIMSQMFSPVVLLIGISQLMSTLGLNDNIWGLIFVNAAFNQAFAIWLLRGTFISISPEMEQAARIDGCSTIGSLIRILLPMAAPGIVTTLIFVFINAWNEYTISTVLITTASKKPITVGITQFSSFNMIEWQYLFAASLLATIPVVILFMFIEKHLTSGLTSGGVKG